MMETLFIIIALLMTSATIVDLTVPEAMPRIIRRLRLWVKNIWYIINVSLIITLLFFI